MNIERARWAHRIWNAMKIEILESGYARLGRDWNHEHLRPPYSRVYYIASGSGTVVSGKQTMPLHAGCVYLLPAGASLRYSCPGEMTQLYFHVSVRTGDGYDLFSRCHQILCLPSQQDPEILCQDYQSGDYLREALLKCCLEADLCRFIAECGLEEILLAQHSAFLEQVFTIVRQELRSSLTIQTVARRLSVSESTLAKRFRREFGMTLGRYIDEMLVEEICRLLTATDLTVGEIAERLGFCDQFYLARFFSARQGLPPREYRAFLRGQA